MPPSSDDLPGRKPPRKQRRAAERAEKKKRGKQPGSPGASMTWEVPDRTEDHYPEGACSCGGDLADAADLGVARSFQQEEIPAAAAERVQHDLHSAKCACGKTHVAPRPAGVPDSALSIGPRLRALAVYLVVFQHVPVERCRQLIADVAGAAVSEGFIHSCLARAASLAAEVVALIRALITAAAVAGFDETTLRSGPAGEKKYVHGAFTERYSAFWLGARSLDAMQDAGILPGFRRDRGLRPVPELRAPRGALLYRLLSGQRMEEVSLGLMPYRSRKAEWENSMAENRQPVSRRQERRAGRSARYGEKLDCLNPSLQKVQRYTRRKDVRNRCRSLPGGSVVTPGIPPGRWSDALSGHSRRRTGHLNRASTYSSCERGIA